MISGLRFRREHQGGGYDRLLTGSRTDDEEAVRLVQGKRSSSVCGHRGAEVGAWRDRVHRAGLGVRSQDHRTGTGGAGGRGRPGHGSFSKKGGGRKRLIEIDPAIEANFHKVLEDHTAGDPMRLEVKWTNLSRRQIANRMADLGTRVSRDVVSQLLRKHRYRRRKAPKKTTMGPRHPDRNAQFEKIARLQKKYLKAGLPVVSMDTKKKELIGNFYRDGVIDTQETIEVNDHDFGSAGSGVVIPHGIYDVGRNRGYVHLNTSHDTSELACDSLAAWWDDHGRAAYPRAKKLLVLCDGGGSNSATRYVFKEALQKLANRLGIEIRVAHYPPYCSKYNPIEHRLFPHLTRACRGVIFRTLETVRYYMSKTETSTGLTIKVRVLEKGHCLNGCGHSGVRSGQFAWQSQRRLEHFEACFQAFSARSLSWRPPL